ncbi:MAG: branched-chain amino acid ABC transporter permease [Deltaproteobacteria bacterium CG11_big_fil_rev_8_21_14_0_20_47_16]|nr:MAG: branched-chain amino acid ABC transporter permease [Deltaproteobacteria bacterium CG11_big_fil_rev_8_21_14_0_20_47_16]
MIDPYFQLILLRCGVAAIMAVSLNLINGFTGQFSLGHAGFMAIGAYVSAAVSVFLAPHAGEFVTQVWFLIALLSGGIAAGLMGLLVGLPTLRLRGDYLAIATLGFAVIIRVVILNLDVVGGARGMTDIPELSNGYWIFGTLAITVWIINNLVYSIKGYALTAISEDEIATASIGISTTKYKVMAFVVGAFFAGIGGGLYAHLESYLNTNSFTFLRSFEFVAMVVLGGMGSITGSIVAAFILTILPEALRGFDQYRMIIYSLMLIVLMLTRPTGIFGRRELWRWNRGKT